jgi:TatD DNase family protein
MPMLIDTHCHLAILSDAGEALYSIIHNAKKVEVNSIVDISVGTDDFMRRSALVKEAAEGSGVGIWMTAGISPYYAGRRIPGDVDLVKRQARGGRTVIAIGEIGLDYHHTWGSRVQQIELLSEQLEAAGELDLPVVVHMRDSDGDTLEVLARSRPARGGVIHCFSSGPESARGFLDLGFFLSFAGNLTYRGSTAIREAARFVPSDRYLVETDSPYLSPGGLRGRRNEPGFLKITAEFLAELRGIPFERLAEETTRNAGVALGVHVTDSDGR